MKLDAHVIVGADNETLLARSYTYPLSRLIEGYFVFREQRGAGRPVYVGRSIVDTAGRELMLEQFTPRTIEALSQGLITGSGLSRVEVWHKVTPDFRETDLESLQKVGFKQVGQFLLAPAEEEALLDEAYGCSQNLTHSWVPLKDGKGCRSTSVGDVLVLHVATLEAVSQKAFQVMPVGFEEVSFQ